MLAETFLERVLADPEAVARGIEANWVLWLVSVVAIATLVFGADRAVSGAVRLAKALGMSRAIIGATVVSLGTTSPETFVSVTAAFGGQPGLALGNGIGSVICNAALIFGLCGLIRPLPKDRFILNRHGLGQLAAGLSLAACMGVLAILAGGLGGVVIGRPVGIVFLVLLGGYMLLSVRWAKQHPEGAASEANGQTPTARRLRGTLGNLLLIAVGLAVVIVSAKVVIVSVSELCRRYEVPPNILAVTLVAFGTSLPELVTGIVAIARGHAELLVGNVIGANVLNIWFVIGASATVANLKVDAEFFQIHVPVMLLVLLLVTLFSRSRGATFRRWQAALLLTVFVGYYLLLLGRMTGA